MERRTRGWTTTADGTAGAEGVVVVGVGVDTASVSMGVVVVIV
jgi:hypothetical protein